MVTIQSGALATCTFLMTGGRSSRTTIGWSTGIGPSDAGLRVSTMNLADLSATSIPLTASTASASVVAARIAWIGLDEVLFVLLLSLDVDTEAVAMASETTFVAVP